MKRIIKSVSDWNNKRKLIREMDILIDRCTNGNENEKYNICANIRNKINLKVKNRTSLKSVSTLYVIMQICRRFRLEGHMTVNGLPFYKHTFEMNRFNDACYWWKEASGYSNSRIIFLEVLKEFIKERSFDDIIYYITDHEGWKKKN